MAIFHCIVLSYHNSCDKWIMQQIILVYFQRHACKHRGMVIYHLYIYIYISDFHKSIKVKRIKIAIL
uniref:Uncharacterized protein n=1 Tax=Arundo donax TaxID=35708 RepID=A0A0A9E1M2_ARUDO